MEIFKDISIKEGIPENKILIEKEATNTYENFKYSLHVLEENNLHAQSFLIVEKTYQERRTQQIAKVELSTRKFCVAPSSMAFTDFLEYVETNNIMKLDDIINKMVAEINIGIIAPRYGIQQKDEIPEEVLESYERLCEAGYTKYLVTDDLILQTIEKCKKNNYTT